MNKVKNTIIKRHIALKAMIIAILMVAMTTMGVFAGSVSYEGESQGFIFSPGGSSSPTNLFEGTSALMPGDTITESIVVKNNSSDDVKVYMKALGATDKDKDFLSKLSLSVESQNAKIFNASASDTAGLTEWTLLGTLSKGGSTSLSMSLSAPIELENEYQDAKGDVNWQFMVESEKAESDKPNDSDETDEPDESEKAKKTKTGDETRLIIPVAVLVAAAGGIVFIRRRKRT